MNEERNRNKQFIKGTKASKEMVKEDEKNTLKIQPGKKKEKRRKKERKKKRRKERRKNGKKKKKEKRRKKEEKKEEKKKGNVREKASKKRQALPPSFQKIKVGVGKERRKKTENTNLRGRTERACYLIMQDHLHLRIRLH